MMLTKRRMIQAIADRMSGLKIDPSINVNDFQEPYRSIYLAVDRAPSPSAARQAVIEALRGYRDKDLIFQAIIATPPGQREAYESLAEIADRMPPIQWLWPGWIPRGMITLLGAIPGAGKSYVALDFAKRIIHNEPWPDGAEQLHGGAHVIYVDAEVVPQLITARARRWGMNMRKLYLMMPKEKLFIDFSDPNDRDHLTDMALDLKPALIVIDSLSSISTKGENNIEDVRDVLSFLNRLAVEMECAVLLIHHLRKRGALPLTDVLSIDDFRGSGHIIAMARSVLGLTIVRTGEEVDRNGPRRLEVIKTNLARYPEPLGIEFLPLEPEGVLLRYGDAPQPYKEPTKQELCEAWLLDLLKAEGPMKPKEILRRGEEEGFGKAIIYRARKRLSDAIVNTSGRQSPNGCWALKGQEEQREC